MVELRSKRKSLETVTPPTKKRANSVKKSGKGADGKVQQELAVVEPEQKDGVNATEAPMDAHDTGPEQKSEDVGNDVPMESAGKSQEEGKETNAEPQQQLEVPSSAREAPKVESQDQAASTSHSQEPPKTDVLEAKGETPKSSVSTGAPAAESQKTQTSASSSEAQRALLEKGLIYFFYKPKVSVEGEAESVDDVQRSFFVLKPLKGHLKEEEVVSAGTARLVALPKKTLPGPIDHGRNLTFVTKANATMEDIRGELHSLQYETATVGSRENPSGRPIGEGAYAIIRVGRTSHLVYELTIPKELTDLHKDFGLLHHGSFTACVKNPDTPSPPQARLPEKAEYPSHLKEKFQGRRWNALEPEFLDHVNCEMLLIGEHANEKITELDQLEHEDELRAEKLDNSVFEDLKLGSDFHDQTTSSWPQ